MAEANALPRKFTRSASTDSGMASSVVAIVAHTATRAALTSDSRMVGSVKTSPDPVQRRRRDRRSRRG